MEHFLNWLCNKQSVGSEVHNSQHKHRSNPPTTFIKIPSSGKESIPLPNSVNVSEKSSDKIVTDQVICIPRNITNIVVVTNNPNHLLDSFIDPPIRNPSNPSILEKNSFLRKKITELEKTYKEELKKLQAESDKEKANHYKLLEKFDDLREKKIDLQEENKELESKLALKSTLLNELKETLDQKEKLISRLNGEKSSPDQLQRKSPKKRKQFERQNYDFKVHVNSLRIQKYGWLIEKDSFFKESKEEFSLVGFLGLEGKGKTFLLQNLCKLNLNKKTPKGINIKYFPKNNIACLDTKTSMSKPINYYKQKTMKRFLTNAKSLTEEIRLEMWNDQKLTEMFIEDFVIEYCEVVILVVGVISEAEQVMIHRISRKIQEKFNKKLIIVHNLMEVFEISSIPCLVESEIKEKFQTYCKFLSNQNNPEWMVSEYIEKNSKGIEHFILGRNDSECGEKCNQIVFEKISDILETTTEKRPFHLVEEIKKFMRRNSHCYFNSKNPIELQENQDKLTINPELRLHYKKISVNNTADVSLPPYVVSYNEDKGCYLCSIEIPNLDINSLKLSLETSETSYVRLKVQGSLFSKIEDSYEVNKYSSKSGIFTYFFPLTRNQENNCVIDYEKKVFSKAYELGVLKVTISLEFE